MKNFLFIVLVLGLAQSAAITQNWSSKLVAPAATIQCLDTSYSFTEGPAVDPYGNVYFTDQPNNRILKWTASTGEISTFMENAGRSNGLYFDHRGILLACADEKNQLWQIDSDGSVKVLVKDFEGNRLNGPNDLWVDKKGGIYFTDPFYKRKWWSHTDKEIEEERVYYRSPDGKSIRAVASDFKRPNGIVGSKDGKRLYVADIGDKKTYVFIVSRDGSLTDRRLFTDMGSDGMTIDHRGNLYLTGKGVTVFSKKGVQVDHIPIDQRWTANVVFGGQDQKTLFITAMGAVYSLKMRVHGVR
ncbi:MAG: SMP-30/gluconolactonase/LRE family protein [Saprospiraceae bacterium]|nr:SMP-30/gluconolactonase/LRE family protein [Saprospiraceae bacterium]